MNQENYKILIAEDHPIVSEGIRSIALQLGDTTCKTPRTLEDLQQVLKTETFDLYIIDLGLHGTNGFQVIEKLNKEYPAGKILVYTMHGEPWIVAKLSTLNIQGAVAKNSHIEELQTAIKAIRKGETYFSEEFSELETCKKCHPEAKSIPSELADREKEVLTYLSQGMSTSEIAERMYLSTNTVHTYRKRLLDKLNAKNVAELIYKTKNIF